MPNYALVTGGSRGIGRAICLKLAEQGFNLLINYRSNLERAQQTLTEVQEFGIEAELSGGRSPLPNEDFRDVNFAYKGLAIRLDKGEGGIANGNTFVLFDHDLLRMTGFWTGEGFMDYEGILLNDRHNIFPRTVGQIQLENPITPGWANPANGSFKDPRFVAVDGRPFGPLPREWAHYKGLYYHPVMPWARA